MPSKSSPNGSVIFVLCFFNILDVLRELSAIVWCTSDAATAVERSSAHKIQRAVIPRRGAIVIDRVRRREVVSPSEI